MASRSKSRKNRSSVNIQLSAPTMNTFYLAILFVALGVIGRITTWPIIWELDAWLILIGFIILAIGNLRKGW